MASERRIIPTSHGYMRVDLKKPAGRRQVVAGYELWPFNEE